MRYKHLTTIQPKHKFITNNDMHLSYHTYLRAMNIRVAIFEDNMKRLDGLKLLINGVNNMTCVGAYVDCSEVLENIASCSPDVVLMDIDMPYVNGIEGTAIIKKHYPNVKILIQTVFEDADKVFEAICAGADGYLLKQESPLQLIHAIEDVLKGGGPMTPSIAHKVLSLFRSKNRPKERINFELTKREQEILELLVKGFSYKMIASECFISFATVNSHVTKIYQKLQVNSVSAAVSKAIKEGIVD